MSVSTGDGEEAFARSFELNGFGVVRTAIDPHSVAQLHSRIEAALASSPDQGTLQRIVPRLVELDKRFVDLATAPPLLSLLTRLLRSTPQLISSYGHEKPAGTAAHTAPHSDVAHLPGVPQHLSTIMIKAMFALTPVARGGGGTLLYPGSHKLAGESLDSLDSEYVMLEPGDLLLFHANIFHTATGNSGAFPRLSLWYVFSVPWMRLFPGYEYSEDFLRDLRSRNDFSRICAIFGQSDPYST